MTVRMQLHKGILGAALLLASFGIFHPPQDGRAFAAETADPQSVVAAIYKEELKSSGTDWMTRKGRSHYLTSSLLSLWNRAEDQQPKDDELGMIDFDLAADTNGLTLAGFDPKIEKQGTDTATIAVKLRYKEKGQRPGLVRYDVIRENDAWKIDEIRTKAWSLRGILNLNLKKP